MDSPNPHGTRRSLEPRCYNPEYWPETSTSLACRHSEHLLSLGFLSNSWKQTKKSLRKTKRKEDAKYFSRHLYVLVALVVLLQVSRHLVELLLCDLSSSISFP